MYKIISGVFVLLMLVSQQCMAIDKSIYYGKWKGVECNNLFSLELSKNTAIIKIRGEEVVQDIKHQNIYSHIAPYPFLSLIFTDKNDTEHLLYVVVGTDKNKREKLTGFYEKSEIVPNSHGKLESFSEKIEFIKSE